MSSSPSSNNAFNSFSITQPQYGSKEFLQSNTLVGKFAFLILVLFGFIILFRLGTMLITFILGDGQSPHFIDGMVDATQMQTFNQDPSLKGSKTVVRSNNENDGIEFTWSIWIFINNPTILAKGKYQHIFSKGDNDPYNGSNFIQGIPLNNAPGLYIGSSTDSISNVSTQNLLLIMNTYNNPMETIEIDTIPINKWVNIVIRCQNTVIDVYINGIITQSSQLSGVPKQNYGDVYTSMNGGFSGYISNLWYYNYALSSSDIMALNQKGPNMKMIGANGLSSKKPDYLSLAWYFNDSTPQVISVPNSVGLNVL
jgi:hypothetical protein